MPWPGEDEQMKKGNNQNCGLHCYDDMIGLPHPVSAKHPQMPVSDRAAQFSPFAALTGYEAVIREAARLTDTAVELDEDSKEALDEKLRLVQEQIREHPVLTVVYFEPDAKKAGGAYITVTGAIKRIDPVKRHLVMMDGTVIRMEDVVELDGELF